MIVIESGGEIFFLSRMSVLPNNVGRGHEDSDNNVRAVVKSKASLQNEQKLDQGRRAGGSCGVSLDQVQEARV